MSRNARNSSYLILLLVLYVLPVFAAQETKEVAPTEALKARVVFYYEALKKGERTAPLDFVAPESKNDFAYMNNEGLVDFRILDMHLSDAGDTATVRIQRTDNFLGFPQLLKRQTVDTWKRIDGQWYVLLPVHKENEVLDTPFGKMTFSGQRENRQQATPPILLGPQNAVTPEQAKKALQKAMLESSKQKPGDQEKKPEDKKSEDQPVPKPDPQN